MRRKRRNRGNWMPVLGHFETDNAEGNHHFSDFLIPPQQVRANTGEFGSVTFGPIPLIPDFTLEPDVTLGAQPEVSLHDRISGNAWSLQRIVGKAHLSCIAAGAAQPSTEIWTNVLVQLGFLVARADDNVQAVCDLTGFESDPMQAANSQNPWIWRRQWVLGNPQGDDTSFRQRSTADYGSVADGPHIDSKVKRYIPREHRLWMVLSARGFNPLIGTAVTDPDNVQPAVQGSVDLRVYGQLRRGKNTSSF